MSNRLPARQRQLYDLLLGQGDVPIRDLFQAMGGPTTMDDTNRNRQAWLSPYVRRLNRRLDAEGLVVTPGQLKQTYRLLSNR